MTTENEKTAPVKTRVSKLKAKDPKSAEPSKPKMVLFGPSGVGKTWFSLSFPKVYYIACEDGASRSHYTDRLKSSGGVYLGREDGALDFDVLIDQVKALATEKHEYKTLVVDSITKIFNEAVSREADRLGEKNAFGADKKPAIAHMRRLISAVSRLDMNVLLIAHEKAEWGVDSKGDRAEIGKCPDCWDNLIYELDLAFQARKRGALRECLTKKSRLVGFPEGEAFKLDFGEFSTRYGVDIIDKESKPIIVATEDQVREILRLVDLLKIDAATIDKWHEKANAESFAEYSQETAAKVIESLTNKLKK